jgi:hypothetical protein
VSFSVVLVTRAGSVPAITGVSRFRAEAKIGAVRNAVKINRKVLIAAGMVCIAVMTTPCANTSATSYPPVTFST